MSGKSIHHSLQEYSSGDVVMASVQTGLRVTWGCSRLSSSLPGRKSQSPSLDFQPEGTSFSVWFFLSRSSDSIVLWFHSSLSAPSFSLGTHLITDISTVQIFSLVLNSYGCEYHTFVYDWLSLRLCPLQVYWP